jgi:hypothetical protein
VKKAIASFPLTQRETSGQSKQQTLDKYGVGGAIGIPYPDAKTTRRRKKDPGPHNCLAARRRVLARRLQLQVSGAPDLAL